MVDLIGKTILHYKIIKQVGQGGMGVVYKAEDTKLERFVAIKFLPSAISRDSDARQRFKIEAKAAAALNHPNITTIYSIEETEDEMFIVMELVDGIELKEKIKKAPLQTNEIIKISLQIAEGLKIAHSKGIIHRDIKSSNIMLTKDDVIKIMDFGLAKIKGDTEITKLGTTVGTTYYMSPEQTKGESIDSRTDIWSFGVLLYQMFTGEFPFKGDYDQAVVYSILNEDFPSMKNYNPSIPIKLEFIIQKMLKKNPGERYQNLSEFIKDLKTFGGEDVIVEENIIFDRDVPSIAILSFENISGEEENEYFSDGLAEDIISNLARIKDLKVVAGTSAFSFKNIKADVKEIGKKLNVKTILEASVQKSNYNIQVTARLINVEDGYYLWSEQYNRILEDIFSIQGEITSAIIEKLKVHLLKNVRSSISKRHIKNLNAFNWFLKGRYFYNDSTSEGMKKSIECFEKAIKIEPDYAVAYAGIADSYNTLGAYYYLPAEKSFPKAIDAAKKAIELDDSLSEAHCALGHANYEFKWDWKSAEKSFLKGIKVKPGYSYSHLSYAYFLLMLAQFDEAHREISFAWELDPLGLITNTNVGYFYFLSREYDTALGKLKKALEINPNYYPLLSYIAKVYEQKGLLEDALEIAKQAYKTSEMNSYCLAELGYFYALSGNKMEALHILEQLKERSTGEFVSTANFVTVYLGLNDTEKIFHWLEKSLVEKAPLMSYLKVNPRFDKIRTDDRFIALMKKVGLA